MQGRGIKAWEEEWRNLSCIPQQKGHMAAGNYAAIMKGNINMNGKEGAAGWCHLQIFWVVLVWLMPQGRVGTPSVSGFFNSLFLSFRLFPL